MKRILLLALCGASMVAMADTCLQTDKKGAEGDSRYYDYGKCTPRSSAADNGNSLNVIGNQLQGIMSRRSESNDSGYSDAEREAYRQSDLAFKQGQNERRSFVKYGASVELGGIDYSKYLYGSDIPEEQKQAIRAEIGTAINTGKLIETYGDQHYEKTPNNATWQSTDAATRWKACEVATQLARAYAFGDFIQAGQKNPARGLAIADAGYANRCGGTSYWRGRIFEEGDALVPGVDKKALGDSPKWRIEESYDAAILNGYTPAYERMAELYRLGGPERYRGKKYYSFPKNFYPYWRNHKDSDQMYMTWFQYGRCLQAEPANLVCARGLRDVFADTHKDFLDGYTNYNKELAEYYDKYVKNLETLLANAGQPVPAQVPAPAPD